MVDLAHVQLLLSLLDSGTDKLLTTVRGLTENDLKQPSGLPGWSRAHVLSHLLNNAEAHRRMAEGAARGETIEQYPGGHAQRDLDTMRNAEWPADKLISGVERSASELRTAWSLMTADSWAHHIKRVSGLVEAWIGLEYRAMEVEVHHVDLLRGYQIQRWPRDFVDVYLPKHAKRIADLAASNDGRWQMTRDDGAGSWDFGGGAVNGSISGSGRELLAWILGRADGSALRVEGDATLARGIVTRYPYG